MTERVFKWSMLAYLAILPMTDTIALRNLILLVLLLILMGWMVREGYREIGYVDLLRVVPAPLLAWSAFLLLFPLWAAQPQVALSNLNGQWGESLLAWVVGLGAVLMLGRRGPSLGELARASGFLVGLHLLLTLAAWVGLFGTLQSSYLPWSSMWSLLVRTVSSTSGEIWHWQSFPWRFLGFDPMHGNLGYAASQTIALLAACYVLALRENQISKALWSMVGIGACLLSLVVASSRGGVLYSMLLIAVASAVYSFRLHHQSMVGKSAVIYVRYSRWIFVVLGLVLLVALVQTVQTDSRWRTMVDKARAGFLIEDPVTFLCDGLSFQDRNRLQERFGAADSVYAEQIIDGLNSDGGRIVLMRVGLEMLWQQPFGLDGSRQSYKKMMISRCGHVPVFDFAHTHQSWVDLSLALGWGGLLLFALLLGCFLVAGWRALRNGPRSEWAFALVLLSGFWILRGGADSLYREHYLQMQALLLGYVHGRMRLHGRR